MSSTKETIPTDLLSNYDMRFMFDTNLQQIYRWRWNMNLPFYNISGGGLKKPPVRYSLAEVLLWALKNEISIVNRPATTKTGKIAWLGKKGLAFRRFVAAS